MPVPAYRWVVLAVAILAFMQTHLHRMAFAPLIPTFVGDLGLTYAAAGAIQTAYFVTYAVAQVPVGVLADRWGARRVMLVSMAVLAAGSLAFAVGRTYGAAIGARMLLGLGAAAVWVPGISLISEWFPAEERGRATGLMSAGGGLGGTIALIGVPWIASAWGWRTAYGFLALPALLSMAIVAVALAGGRGRPATRPPSGSGLRRVLGSRAVWVINATVCLSYGGYFSFLTFLPAYLVSVQGLTATQAGLVTSLLTGGTILSWPLAGVLSDRLGRRKPLYFISQIASALVCVAFATIATPLGPLGASALAVAGGILIGGVILPYVMIVELFPPQLAATAAGVTNTACFVGGLVLPIVLGRVVDLTGGFALAFVVAGAMQACALGFGAFMTETGRARYTAPR